VTENITQNEFSIEVDLTSLSPSGKVFRMTLSQEDCTRVAKRLRLVSLKSCAGEIKLTHKKSTICAVGSVQAELTRECVSSLEEMDETINESFEIEFLGDDSARDADEDIEEWGLPEIHKGNVFDVGELLIQQLSLSMAPFPRKDGAKSLADVYGVEPEASPFAVLQQNFEKDENNH